jgi:hypothetical protein
MQITIKIIGIIFISLAVWFFIDTKMPLKISAIFIKGPRIYIAAAFRILLGIVFLLAASHCDKEWIINVIGIIMLISGITIFAMGLEKARSILQWFQNRPAGFLRLPSIVIFIIGCLTIYAA